MIDIEYEKSKKLTTEQITMILDFAAQAASDEGYINSFIFERAVCVFAAQALFPEKKELIASAIGNDYDIRLAFDNIAKDGTLEKMLADYPSEMKYLLEDGKVWLEEVAKFQQSVRGILDSINTLSGDIVKTAAEQLQKAASGDAQIIQEFANKWGLDRDFKEAEQAVKDPVLSLA